MNITPEKNSIISTGVQALAIASENDIKAYIKKEEDMCKWGKESDFLSTPVVIEGKTITALASWETIKAIFNDITHPKNDFLLTQVFGSKTNNKDKNYLITPVDHCLIIPSEIIEGAKSIYLPLPLALVEISSNLVGWVNAKRATPSMVNNSVMIEMVFKKVLREKILFSYRNFIANRTCEWLREIKNTNISTKNKKAKTEQKIQINLATKLKGRIEVHTVSGIIDILTDTEIIKVKNANQWKSAIGQVIAYQQYFPALKKRIHLFSMESLPESAKPTIELICKNLDIKVTYE